MLGKLLREWLAWVADINLFFFVILLSSNVLHKSWVNHYRLRISGNFQTLNEWVSGESESETNNSIGSLELKSSSPFCLFLGDIDDCVVQPTPQTQFTPLPEALCDVIMDLTSQGQSATIENIKLQLGVKWVDVAKSKKVMYLVKINFQVPTHATAINWDHLRRVSPTNAGEKNLPNFKGLFYCNTRVCLHHVCL